LNVRSVVVVHRLAMVAEGIAAALSEFAGIASVGMATSVEEGERLGRRADAVAMDLYVAGAEAAAGRLRQAGVRVVIIGEPSQDDEGVRVSPGAPLGALALALVPQALSAPVGRLTDRERDVLALVAQGLAGKQVARQLGISPKTVELHKTRIFTKLGVPNQTAAVRVALNRGIGGSSRWISASI
jgi:DNA-binding NarL/FixJ family response regulator